MISGQVCRLPQIGRFEDSRLRNRKSEAMDEKSYLISDLLNQSGLASASFSYQKCRLLMLDGNSNGLHAAHDLCRGCKIAPPLHFISYSHMTNKGYRSWL